MNRREFLRLTGLVTLPVAVPLLSSCTGKKGGTSGSPSPTDVQASATFVEGSLASLANASPERADLIDAQPETLLGEGRLAFGLRSQNAALVGANLTLYIGQDPDKPPTATTRASWVQGELADKGLYVAEFTFPSAGEWLVGLKAQTKDGRAYGGGARVAVKATSQAPIKGQPAISVPTPTTGNLLGADPLCSNAPVCSMHAISLDAALKNGKPTVLTFSAPAYCATETCGPVVRLVDAEAKKVAGKANFIHVEAYDKDNPSPDAMQPPLVAWHVNQIAEPFTFFIDAKGIVVDRLPGAFGEQELADRVAKLLR